MNKNKLMSASQRETLSALAKSVRAAADDLVGKEEAQSLLEPIAANHSPLKLSGDITNASIGGGRKLQESCPDGSGLTVTSSNSALAGCYVELEVSDVANSHPEYYSGYALMGADVLETDPTTVNTVKCKDEGYISTFVNCILFCFLRWHNGFSERYFKLSLPRECTYRPSERGTLHYCGLSKSHDVATGVRFRVEMTCAPDFRAAVSVHSCRNEQGDVPPASDLRKCRAPSVRVRTAHPTHTFASAAKTVHPRRGSHHNPYFATAN